MHHAPGGHVRPTVPHQFSVGLQQLRRLHKAGLKLDIEKLEFAFSEVKYLRFIISAGEGIKINPGKVEAIKKWEAPIIVKGVRSFIGFLNFYRGFIENFSEIIAPLMLLIQKNQA
jgi:hypothetical protein